MQMKRNLSSVSKKNKKQRGVAVIFTLGILGLLTVMALGFASTALLNNSLSKNVMNTAYARSLAKNLALTQVLYVINKEIMPDEYFDYRNIYSWGPDSDANSKNHKDFLWRLDYSDAGVQMFKYEPDKAAGNPANNVRWQYVKDTSSPTAKIIGRYAYVVIPDKGRLDPSVNIGRLASEASAATPAAATFSNVSSESDLKQLETLVRSNPGSVDTSAWNSAFSNSNKFRWATYRELIKKVAAVDAFYMFQYNGITPSITMKSPEAFLKNGELYSRFNMNRSDWNTITVDKLCGIASKSTSGSETTYTYEPLSKFPAEQKFIPWLQDMHKKSDALKTQAHQIAANIIQYNRTNDQSTVTDKDDTADWLTTDPPSYAGIGRHPMLNEIGFLVRVSVYVETEQEADPDENHIRVKYTPVYRVTIDTGAELIDPFGIPASSLQNSIIQFSGIEDSDTYTWKYPDSPPGQKNDPTLTAEQKKIKNMLMKFKLSKFKRNDSSEIQNAVNNLENHNTPLIQDGKLHTDLLHEHLDRIVVETTGKYGKTIDSSTVLSEEGSGSWINFDLSLASGDWNASPAYTKAASFWKGRSQRILKIPIRSFTMTTAKTVNGVSYGKDDLAKAIARRMTITCEDFTPGTVVLKYGPAASEKQRDMAVLTKMNNNTTPPTHTPLITFTMTDMEMTTPEDEKEYVKFIAYEAADPLVNHTYENETWKITQSALKSWTGGYNDYPGTYKDSNHKNSTVTGDDPAASTAGTAITRQETAFIRHGQMRSFWELGCISRGEAWKTLNLLKKDNSTTLAFSYDKGDAVLFDQLKFTDENYTAGKINLNTDVHQVLEKIFNSGLIKYKQTLGTVTSATMNDLLLAGSDPGEGETPVKITAQTLDPSGNPVAHTVSTCLACSLINATKTYNLKNRGDLLSEQSVLPTVTGETKPNSTLWDSTLRGLLKTESSSYLEQIQIVSKLMPLLRTAPVDTLRVVILAQSIRDVGGDIPVLVDWDGTGIETAVPSSEDANKKKAMWKAGYRRTIDGNKLVESESEGVWKEPVLTGTDAAGSKLLLKTYTKNAFGTYDLGRDKITGETKLVATLVRDPEKKKWKLVRLQYVE